MSTPPTPAAPPMPGLQLSSGPAVSGIEGWDGSAATGGFYFKGREPGLIEKLAPWAIAGVLAWALITRR